MNCITLSSGNACITRQKVVTLWRTPIKVIMAKSKLVSVRIDEDLLAQIDAIAQRERYYTRSAIIEAGLKMIALGYGRQDVQAPWRMWPEWDEVTEFTFKYRRKVNK